MNVNNYSWDAFKNVFNPQQCESFSFSSGSYIDLNIMTPEEIVSELDKYVISQTIPKKLIAIAAYNRLLAMRNDCQGKTSDRYYFEKNNVILIGNTGCGKTHLVKSLGEIVSLPVTIQDSTTYTSAGYHGKDVPQIINDLFLQSERLVNKLYKTDAMFSKNKSELVKKYAEYGIVYLDEIDKIRKSETSSKDVNGAAVQEALLKLIEGTETQVYTESYSGKVNTKNMLFMFGGAFSGIEKIIEKRTCTKSIGFNAEIKTEDTARDILKQISVKDLTDYGMLPEFIGRLTTITVLNQLTKENIYDIFTKPKQSILQQITNEFRSFGIKLNFTSEAIEYIIDETLKLKIGARGLKSICQKTLRELYYSFPSMSTRKTVIVTTDMLKESNDE